MFKKIIAVLLAVLMITGLVGCGGEKPKDENKGNDKPKTSDTTDAPVETDEPEPTVDPHDVGESLLSSIRRERLKKRFCLITKSQK